jgi:hypothetical protein
MSGMGGESSGWSDEEYSFRHILGLGVFGRQTCHISIIYQ